ncbi:hypothetical protein [Jiangella asiatica]|uniref:Pyridoxamine 5'-phosphate oxidase family protein n=1 Tax=Jiangella asiatica TaxID=2530372 RepID=A0A4R5CSK1_9ACTN|nr:hypothetical protein [Jiangella asiatica]TDE00663.1 hypothetical protein E1269_24695 [Jiangella asiatica]
MNTPPCTDVRLPSPVAALLDGTDLAGRVGHTISLTTAGDDGWPRLALLSVGEVLSVTGTDLRLALYAGSGTTAALAGSGRALLNLVLDGTSYKIRARVRRIDRGGEPLAFFHGHVEAVDEDRVGYAELVSGITYRLADPAAVVERWSWQVQKLREVAG